MNSIAFTPCGRIAAQRTVVDFAVGCAYEGIELHLMDDGDHRLVDRLDHLWRLAASFLEARGIV